MEDGKSTEDKKAGKQKKLARKWDTGTAQWDYPLGWQHRTAHGETHWGYPAPLPGETTQRDYP